MLLSELIKNKVLQLEDVEFNGCKFKVKLFTEKEAEDMESKEIHEQLAMCIYEGDKSLAELGCTQNLKDNMPLAHKKGLMEIIMKSNGVSVSFDEQKKS